MDSKRRLARLEKTVHMEDTTGRQYVGRYYDELTAEERYQWLKYHDSLISPDKEVDVEAYEQVMGFVCNGLHFLCEDRQKPSTPQELRERVEEVGRIVDEMQEMYRAEKAEMEENNGRSCKDGI